ncbi:MAG: threonine aldolase family protein [Streptosporangiaceae bacterium]
MTKSFASDNHAGVHPEVLEAIARAGVGDQPSYGDDDLTHELEGVLRDHFGPDTRGYVVWGGTGANVVSLAALLRPYEGVICADSAHIYTDECGAAERIIGTKLLPVPAPDGKITYDAALAQLKGFGDQHHTQPKVLSITQASELGTCYTVDEVRALARLVHEHDMYLHVDGARLANAAVSLGREFAQFTTEAGVDIVSLGGTKNGAIGAEAVVVLRPGIGEDLRFLRKQSMQLASKMRFLSAQLLALLRGDLWRRNATHANAMARRLADGLAGIPGVEISYPVEANTIFAVLRPDHIAKLQEQWRFYVWDEARHQVRWMTAFDTPPEDVDAFLAAIADVTSRT